MTYLWSDKDPRARLVSLRILGLVGGPEIVEPLRGVIERHPVSVIREDAIRDTVMRCSLSEPAWHTKQNTEIRAARTNLCYKYDAAPVSRRSPKPFGRGIQRRRTNKGVITFDWKRTRRACPEDAASRLQTSNRESHIRIAPKSFPINKTRISNREKTPGRTSLFSLFSFLFSPSLLIGPPVMRICPKSFALNTDSNSNRHKSGECRLAFNSAPNRASEIGLEDTKKKRIQPKSPRIITNPIPNREKTPARLRHHPAARPGRPSGLFSLFPFLFSPPALLIGSPVIRICPKSFTFNADSSSNRHKTPSSLRTHNRDSHHLFAPPSLVSFQLLAMASPNPTPKDLFLRACRFQPVPRVPVWMMRQAGRFLPEYQAVRAKHSFLEICKTPELAAEVSLQPFRALGVDAIIVFSDILIVAEAMGLPLDVPDSGPILSNPIRDAAAVRRLRAFDPEQATRFVGDAIRLICRAAGPGVPVIGFAAAPWTLACYMIEGQTRGDISRAKQMLRDEPATLRDLLDRIAGATVPYLESQIAAGASAVQLFDTWADGLTLSEYNSMVLTPTQQIFSELARRHLDAPKILFAKGSAPLLESLARSGADVLSVDWRTDLAEARQKLGRQVALQGNIDPQLLLGPEPAIRAAAREAVEKTAGLGHILNLGHGILPATPPANAKAFVEAGQAALAAPPAQAASPQGTS